MNIRNYSPLLILAAVLAAYANSFSLPFIFDDGPNILENPAVHGLWPFWPWLSETMRPVVNFTFALNYTLGGFHVWGYHAVNAVVHALAALALLGVARRTLRSGPAQKRYGPGADLLALGMALIWAVHPLQTQCVDYIVQRAEALMGLFYFCTLYCAMRGTEGKGKSIWSALAVAACALGMGSKAIMATAPLVVLLHEKVFLSRSFGTALRRRKGMYAGLAATWLLLAALMAWAPSAAEHGAGFGFEGVTPLQYALTQPGVLVRYLKLTLWPSDLTLDYGWPVAHSWQEIVPPLAVIGALLAATVWALWRRPALGFLGAWFFLTLAPTSSFIPLADLAFEHRMYLALAAPVALFVLGVWEAARAKVLIFLAAIAVVAVCLACATFARNRDYADEFTMWSDAAAKRPENARAHNNLGKALSEMGRDAEAVDRYREAVRLMPWVAETHDNLGNVLTRLGRPEEALPEYYEALRLKPDFAKGHVNLGTALGLLGRREEALKHFQEALRINPAFGEAHYNLGVYYADGGALDQAELHYREALRLKPSHANAHNNLASVLAKKGKAEESARQYAEAIRHDPGYAEAHSNYATVLADLGQWEEAEQHCREALRLKPDFAEAQNNWGMILGKQGRMKEAITHFEEALRLKPDYAAARQNMALARQLLPKQEQQH